MASAVTSLGGYHRIARVMTGDTRAAIFRRFPDMQILNLLSLQAETMELRSQLLYQSKCDEASEESSEQMYSRWFWELHNSGGAQLAKLHALRVKLKEYNEAVMQVSSIMKLPSPRKSECQTLCDWLCDSHGGNCFQLGTEARTWINEDNPALDVSPFLSLANSTGEDDFFTMSLTKFVLKYFHRMLGAKMNAGKLIDEESGLRSYNDSTTNTASSVITTITSSVLPMITILILYEIHSPYGRIGAAVGFTTVFATFLSLFSRARRIEIFVATAAFAAVEVVFIGSALKT